MNFFFGFQNEIISSEITVPKFDYSGKQIYSDYKIFSAEPDNEHWKVNIAKVEENKNFFLIKNSEINNKKIFFLSKESQIKDNLIRNDKLKNLYNFNTFSDNKIVEFRANLKIYLENYGFSSYQSDYNFNLCRLGGNILSPINSLLDRNSETNIIIFRNICTEPIFKKYKYYFIDFNKKKILYSNYVTNNLSNEIIVPNSMINDGIFFFTVGIIGIPIFISIKEGHLSMEHTHPPHHYILSQDRFKLVSNLKDKFKKIVELND